MAKFNAKTFNPNAFGKYMERVPQPKKNELIKSRALRPNGQIRDVFRGQTGTFYATIPMYGLIDGAPVNYDGATNIEAESSTTFERGVIVVGRAKAWVENDFAEDITDGADFMGNVAGQLGTYWDGVNQDTLLSILNGIYAMTGTGNLKFVDGHTYDVTVLEGNDPLGNPNNKVGAASLNKAIQKASGDKKSIFRMAIMHSEVATNLENLKLLKYMVYTDADGIQRELELGTWNGRVVIVDDAMPTEDVAESAPGAGDAYTKYTTYILGEGAFDYEDLGVEVPYEMSRDPKTNGGQTTLYTRQRKCFAPKGISFKKASVASLSPTDSELADGANWELVNDGGVGSNRKYYDHKQIPIARVISRG